MHFKPSVKHAILSCISSRLLSTRVTVTAVYHAFQAVNIGTKVVKIPFILQPHAAPRGLHVWCSIMQRREARRLEKKGSVHGTCFFFAASNTVLGAAFGRELKQMYRACQKLTYLHVAHAKHNREQDDDEVEDDGADPQGQRIGVGYEIVDACVEEAQEGQRRPLAHSCRSCAVYHAFQAVS